MSRSHVRTFLLPDEAPQALSRGTRGTDLSLRLGATDAQFDDVDAMLPYYLQLGCGVQL